MKKRFKGLFFLPLIWGLLGCGDTQNSSSKNSSLASSPLQPAVITSKNPPANWQEAIEQHKDTVRNRKSSVYSQPAVGYIFSKDDELLIIWPGILLSKAQQSEVSLEPNVYQSKYSNYSKEMDVEGTTHKFTLINGKLFVDNRRIYDVSLLTQIGRYDADTTAEGRNTLLQKYIANAIEPSPEDQELLRKYLENPASVPTLNFEELENPTARRPSLSLSAGMADLSQAISFKKLRNRGAEKGLLNIDNASLDLTLPLFISFESLPNMPILGTMAFKFKHQYLGVAYVGDKPSSVLLPQHEISAVYGINIGSVFLETQAGNVYKSPLNTFTASSVDHRYQLTLGWDTPYITPFIRGLSRALEKTNHNWLGAGIEGNFSTSFSKESKLSLKVITTYLLSNSHPAVWCFSCKINYEISKSLALNLVTDIFNSENSNFGFEVNFEK